MLVLSRKIGEMLKIGDEVKVQILDISRGQVRIGIAAPKSINIVRTELLDRPRKPEVHDAATQATTHQKPPVRIFRRRSY